MTDAEKEKIKLRAAYANGVAIAIAVTGAVVPIITLYLSIFDGIFDVSYGKLLGALLVFVCSAWLSKLVHTGALKHLDKLYQP